MSTVYLVGAGPGDPELLTLKGRRVLEKADVILYDHLANPLLLKYARPDAECLYVGKKRASHAFTQEEIIATMVDRAGRGLTVVRLKGGDPYIFGRGGEEAQELALAGISCEVVPGVTAPLGIAAYTGVPLTHREHSSAVTFVTGHEIETIDWTRTGVQGTLVIFMGRQHLAEIAGKLLEAGRPPETPAMAVRWGTRPDQRIVTGTLASLPQLVDKAGLLPPVTVFIGEVVALRGQLSWFEKRPLFGSRVIVTRPAAQSAELCFSLRELGAEVLEIPVIRLAPVADYSELDGAVRHLEAYDWIVFTSVNAVEYFFERVRATGRDARAIQGKVCAIGPATANALLAANIVPDLLPGESTSEGVAAAFACVSLRGSRVLMPRASEAREIIPQTLCERGAIVDVVNAYRNVIPEDAPRLVREYLETLRPAEWIVFTSGSAVRNWVTLGGSESLQRLSILSIGPATSEVVRKHGFEVRAEADPHTEAGLINALLAACGSYNRTSCQA